MTRVRGDAKRSALDLDISMARYWVTDVMKKAIVVKVARSMSPIFTDI
jgi:hypothetical protein